MAVGSVDTDAGRVTPLAERWDGSRWSVERTMTSGGGTGFLTAVSCPTTAGCIAAGTSPSGDPVLSERWNHSGWSLESVPTTLVPGSYEANGLSGLTITRCLLVPAPLRLTTAGWTTSPNQHTGLLGVSCVSPPVCIGVGSVSNGYPSDSMDAITSTLVER